MALTHEDVRKIATLARLRLTPREEERFAGQLAHVVEYIDQLRGFEGETPAAAVPGVVREMEDRPEECLPRETFLANAPASLDGFLLVPEVKGEGGDA
jgi:aspartyl-tRNA(Asn)/glutamyl-tRNA(Gln) amidotransferase subunit C